MWLPISKSVHKTIKNKLYDINIYHSQYIHILMNRNTGIKITIEIKYQNGSAVQKVGT